MGRDVAHGAIGVERGRVLSNLDLRTQTISSLYGNCRIVAEVGEEKTLFGDEQAKMRRAASNS